MLGWFLGSLFAVLLTGLPIGAALIFSAVVMLLISGLFDAQLVAQNVISGANNFALLAIPFFVFAGEAMNKGGITMRIVTFVTALVGRIKGGLGYVTIISSMIFAGLSGSAISDTAALGGILIPMMDKQGYSKARATALVVCSAIIANVIPPSIGMILYGVSSGVSVTALFMGGIIPGIIIGISLMIVWTVICRKHNLRGVEMRVSFGEFIKITQSSMLGLVLPVFIIVGLRGGIFTPTEAGAMAATYALFVGMFIYRKIKPSDVFDMLITTAKTTAAVVFIAATAYFVGWVITARNVPRDVVATFSDLVAHPTLLMLVCQMLFLLLGMVMDIGPIILIMTPILLPLIKAANISPIYFGIVMVINLTFGLITPPVGLVLYVGSGVAKVSIFETLRYAWPFMMVEVFLILMFSLFPSIILTPLSWILG
jgi:tripartite ATP-independent transporter DctM subunit